MDTTAVMSPQVETGDWRAGAGFRHRRASRGWCCFGLKLGEIREDFLELVFFPLGTFSALWGDDSFRGDGGQLCRGAERGTGSAALEVRCAWLEKRGGSGVHMVRARSKEEGPVNEL